MAEIGFDPMYGARPLRRAIQSNVEDLLSEKILDSTISKVDEVLIKYIGGEYTLEKLHWIKVTRDFRGSNRKAYPGDGIYVTKKQADALIELGLDKEDPMVEGFIHFSEDRW